MSDNNFQELKQPEETPFGWFVSTDEILDHTCLYLHSNLELHEATGDNEKDIWPGYFPTEECAKSVRAKYYAKFNTPVVKQHNEDAWERAMKGLK